MKLLPLLIGSAAALTSIGGNDAECLLPGPVDAKKGTRACMVPKYDHIHLPSDADLGLPYASGTSVGKVTFQKDSASQQIRGLEIASDSRIALDVPGLAREEHFDAWQRHLLTKFLNLQVRAQKNALSYNGPVDHYGEEIINHQVYGAELDTTEELAASLTTMKNVMANSGAELGAQKTDMDAIRAMSGAVGDKGVKGAEGYSGAKGEKGDV